MEIQEIQEKLNNLLSGNERKIVFWYDGNAAYAEEIYSIQINEGCKRMGDTTERRTIILSLQTKMMKRRNCTDINLK